MIDLSTVVCIDFESYYDDEYSLSKMPTHQYIRDERFRCLGCGFQFGNADPFYTEDPEATLATIDWRSTIALAHNAQFDGAALWERFGGRTPGLWLDTQLIARWAVSQGLLAAEQRVSLAALAPLVGMEKGNTREAVDAGGAALAEYGTQDVRIEMALLRYFLTEWHVPIEELLYMDSHVRMAAEPVLRLDTAMLECATQVDPEEEHRKKIARQDKVMVAALESLGVEVEYKTTPAGKRKAALAKTDAFMQELLTHEDADVRELAELRQSAGSSIRRTRAERMLAIGEPFPVPLLYCAAHTRRSGGQDKINPQNLPKGRPCQSCEGEGVVSEAPDFAAGAGGQTFSECEHCHGFGQVGGEHRLAVMAPEGHKLVVGDSSQIEARMVGFRAGSERLLETFRASDPYREFGGRYLYRKAPEALETEERAIAKAGVLGLGFGQGAQGLVNGSRAKAGLIIPEHTAQAAVDAYRGGFPEVPQWWKTLQRLAERQQYVEQPSGQRVVYPDQEYVQITDEADRDCGRTVLTYQRPSIFSKRRKRQRDRVKIWHGLVCENDTQAAARDVVFWQLMMCHMEGLLGERWRIVWMTHDEGVFVAPDEHANACAAALERWLATPPTWAAGLPCKGEVHVAQRYGEAK